MKISTPLAIATLAIATLAMGGCATGSGMGGMAGSAAGTVAADVAARSLAARTPNEALALIALVDQHEMTLARQAKAKNVSGPVMAYADMMEAHHAPHMQQTRAMMDRMGGMPTGSRPVQTLTTLSQQVQARLGGMTGTAYEQAYVARMVMDHQMALAMLDASMGVATDATLRSHMMATRQAVQMHLDQARALQRQMGA